MRNLVGQGQQALDNFGKPYNGQIFVNVFNQVPTSGIVNGMRNTTISVGSTSGELKLFESSHIKRRYMFKLSEMFGQGSGSDAFGRKAVKNIGIRTDIGQTFAETGTTKLHCGRNHSHFARNIKLK